MTPDPWFSSWNYDLFRVLFSYVPHSRITDECCKVLLLDPLLSTWIFAACFYLLWIKDDEQRPQRQLYLVNSVVAFGIAGLITLGVRPWIHWPAPVLNPTFQTLFPGDLWGSGTANCFPSHSTLAYFTIAAGFWPINRRLSISLSGMTLLFISFPRVYEGGHYPIDVLSSCVLSILVLVAVWRCSIVARVWNWSRALNLPESLYDLIFFLWVFELGEAFHSIELLINLVRRALS